MRRTTTVVLAAALLSLTGCMGAPPDDSSTSTDAAPSAASSGAASAAQKLADLDGDVRDASSYQKVLDAWAPRCKETPDQLAGFTYAAVDDLQKNGVQDETEYSALVHLKDSTPAGVKTKCEDVVAAYLTLRES